jgi:hypothetical protein
MEFKFYNIEEEKSIELFPEVEFLSTGDKSFLRDNLTISLFENNDIFQNYNSLKIDKKKNKKTQKNYDSIKKKEKKKRRKKKFLAK